MSRQATYLRHDIVAGATLGKTFHVGDPAKSPWLTWLQASLSAAKGKTELYASGLAAAGLGVAGLAMHSTAPNPAQPVASDASQEVGRELAGKTAAQLTVQDLADRINHRFHEHYALAFVGKTTYFTTVAPGAHYTCLINKPLPDEPAAAVAMAIDETFGCMAAMSQYNKGFPLKAPTPQERQVGTALLAAILMGSPSQARPATEYLTPEGQQLLYAAVNHRTFKTRKFSIEEVVDFTSTLVRAGPHIAAEPMLAEVGGQDAKRQEPSTDPLLGPMQP